MFGLNAKYNVKDKPVLLVSSTVVKNRIELVSGQCDFPMRYFIRYTYKEREQYFYRGYYMVARRYEFYVRVAKNSRVSERVRYCFCHENIKFTSSGKNTHQAKVKTVLFTKRFETCGGY